MSATKTLVIAEKPSVGRDLARVLPGPFQKQEGYLDGPEHVLTWAVGHLVQLAEPDEYDAKFKKWRMADLPIVPDKFKLVVRDERSKKQMSVVSQQLRRDDVDSVVNACDAGREGELIFAYLYEMAGSKKPVQRLWLSSMTKSAIQRAFEHLRPGEEYAELEAAARSRSESDWIVGMNATRAATIRLRSSFDGAVSLGRVQTPTLAIITRREEEIRAFEPEPYWLVDALFEASGERAYGGRYHDGAKPRLPSAERAEAIVEAVRGRTGTITQLERKKRKERAPLLYDLTSLQRDANGRFGFTARRTLAAAQRCYEEHKVLTYPRTSSRYLTSDMIAELKPTAGHVGGATGELAERGGLRPGARHARARARRRRRQGRRPPRDHPDELPAQARQALRRRPPHLRPRRAALPRDLPSRRGVREHEGRDDRRRARVPHAGQGPARPRLARRVRRIVRDEQRRRGRRRPRPAAAQARRRRAGARRARSASLEKETQPPRRYSDASLLGAMETAGRLVEDDEMREAMKESGIGTPATRSSIIERLIDVGYIERDARSLVATEKGLNVIRLLGEHPLTSPSLTGDWENRLGKIERGEEPRKRFMADIAASRESTVAELDAKLKDVRIPRANLGPCPVCGNDIVENRKGFSCWSREDPGCGFVIWKAKAGKTLPIAIAKELIATGRTAKPVTGFKGRSGRSFRAKLALQQSEEGKWRVQFDEAWAREGAKSAPDPSEAVPAAPAGAGDPAESGSAAA